MILSRLQNSPEKAIPVAMALVTTGLMMIVVGIVWPIHSPPVAYGGTNWSDFFRGFTFGIAIVMELTGVVIASAAVRAKAAKKL
ncbi:MAG: hypothetical protein WCA11_09645 [Terracidiphilus sp.]